MLVLGVECDCTYTLILYILSLIIVLQVENFEVYFHLYGHCIQWSRLLYFMLQIMCQNYQHQIQMERYCIQSLIISQYEHIYHAKSPLLHHI
jgi:hypothetical protein